MLLERLMGLKVGLGILDGVVVVVVVVVGGIGGRIGSGLVEWKVEGWEGEG